MLSKHHNLLAFGKETVTVSKSGISAGLNKIEAVVPVLSGGSTTEADKAVQLSVVISDDKKTFSIYAWIPTATANTAMKAATAAVDVIWLAMGE